ncbi:MAG: DNA-3-methyladenine glycosylase 2 family protein [Myxococcota bacterium]|nr:DNA-3-methyladenine glycosylase 2 family protein [bacterium]MDP6073750.1 DNA-3-methyladenine glycosylase 2 family protein [Myxococcota bacterium]MDP6244376.1 DNA-3-methyladenine glycosylase 2 family protein [Myxococcota bacterium]MDP7073380.1 DNA-3-methyladenine glycosylase 2 family protein [Myxococcota bacterium]MDP7297857.1 DNA-3-methyladenine glycosylase 2 family protein [Myxococcota bacterium]
MPERLDRELRERACRVLVRRDRRLAGVIRAAGPCRIRPQGDPYGSLIRSIIFQQLQGRAASAIAGRLRARYGGKYPGPEALAATPDRALRAVGLSRQKIAALRALAEAFSAGSLNGRRLFRMEDSEVVEAVTQVRGIGEWTAHMLLIFSLGRPDVLPVGDYGIRRGAQRVYGLRELPKPVGLERLAEPWRPYRSVGAWYLWRATEVELPV